MFGFIKKTVFFRNGGGLLFVAFVLVSVSLTLLGYQYLPPSTTTTEQQTIVSTTSEPAYYLNPDTCEDGGQTACREYFCSGTNQARLYSLRFDRASIVSGAKIPIADPVSCKACQRYPDGVQCNNSCTQDWECGTHPNICDRDTHLCTVAVAGSCRAIPFEGVCKTTPGCGWWQTGDPATDYCDDSSFGTCPANGNRLSCDTIRGTQYCSDAERTWYLANCVTSGGGGGSGGSWQPGCGVAPRTNMGDCENGDIIDHTNGQHICSDYTGYNGQDVCGNDTGSIKYNYQCQNGEWKNTGQVCYSSTGGSGGSGSTCPNDGKHLSCGGKCWCNDGTCSNGAYKCAAGQTWQCSSAGYPECSSPVSSNPPVSQAPVSKAPVSKAPSKAPANPQTSISPSVPATSPSVSPSIPQGSVNIALVIALDGIGSNTAQGLNNSPNPPTRRAEIKVFDSQGQEKNASADLTYDSSSSSFKGSSAMSTPSGVYTFKVRLNNTLWKAINGVSLTQDQTTTLTSTKLIAGDTNQDNQINLIDYNLLLSCYGGKECSQKDLTDLNSDGKVDEKDLNIMYASFSSRQGD